MACYACFMACKDEHCGWASELSAPQPHMGQYWIDIKEWERGDSVRRVKTATVPTPCSHCQDPSCAKAAKDGAVYKRPDGIVIIHPDKAKGQKQIVSACPIGAVYWNEELQLPQKCTMCAELLDDPNYPGKEPRCVEACPNQALIFGDLDNPGSEINKVIAENRVTQLEVLEGQETNVVHVNIPTIFLAGTVYEPDDEVSIGAQVTMTRTDCGEVYTTETNYFGDWEFEDLPKNKTFRIDIEKEGFRTATLTATSDTDHSVAETLLERK